MASSATAGKFTHLFVKQSALYKDFRPRYPPQLFKEVFKFAFGDADGPVRQRPGGGGGGHAVAVDVATGNGQVLEGLIPAFDKIYAIDASPNQVAQATPYPNVEYKVADAHAMALPDASVDLVTVGQALHWFELPAFYREVRRVLKPGGTLAAWCYDLGTINGDASCEATKVLHDLYEAQLGAYWSDRRRLVEQGYEGAEPRVGADFGAVRKVDVAMSSELSLDGVVGYCKSWSAYQTYRSQHPDRPDPIVKFTDDFRRALLSDSISSGGSGSGTAAGTVSKSSDDAPPDAADGAALPTVQLVRKLTLMLAKDPQPVIDAQ